MGKQGNNKNLALNIAILAGVFAIFIGGWLIARQFYHIMTFSYGDSLSASKIGKVGLILAEVVIVIAFTVFTIFLKTLKVKLRKEVSIYAAIFSFVSIGAILIPYWGEAWYYIFDPAKYTRFSMLIFILALVQGICYVFEALRKK